MRLALLLVVAACSRGAALPPVVSSGVPAPQRQRSCREAAVGLERATRDVRAPSTSIVREVDGRCEDDSWSQQAIACFADMRDGELPRCARLLPAAPRDALLALVGGGGGRAAIEVARARLGSLEVGVGECDRFVAAVTTMLGCEQVPVDARVQLGNETADFWELPTTGLPEDAQRRMADVCGASLAALQAEAANAGCML